MKVKKISKDTTEALRVVNERLASLVDAAQQEVARGKKKSVRRVEKELNSVLRIVEDLDVQRKINDLLGSIRVPGPAVTADAPTASADSLIASNSSDAPAEAPAKKAPAKTPAKKAPAKKTPAKVVAKKVPAKEAPAKAAAKKVPSKKTPAKAAAKKAAEQGSAGAASL